MAAPRSIWNGMVAFGMVNIPIKLVAARREHRIRYRELDGAHRRPVKQVKVDIDGEVVDREQVVKGYEVAKDTFVVFEQGELERIAPTQDKRIAVERFVRLSEVDLTFAVARPYYLVPGDGGDKAFALLNRAMRQTGMVGIGRFVMRSVEHLVILQPRGRAMGLTTLAWSDEVVAPESFELDKPPVLEPAEVEAACTLVQQMTDEWDHTVFEDEHHKRVAAAIEAKANDVEMPEPVAANTSAKVTDIMDALQASIDRAKEAS